MWLPNEPVWVCSPNFLTIAVSPETLLCTFLGVFFLPLSSGSVCVFLCVFMSAFFPSGLSNLHVHTSAPSHLPHLLPCLCKWSSHLGLMKAGIKSECQPAADRFYPALQSRDGEGAGVDTSAQQAEAKNSLTFVSQEMMGVIWRHTCAVILSSFPRFSHICLNQPHSRFLIPTQIWIPRGTSF